MTDPCPDTLSPDEIWLLIGFAIGSLGTIAFHLTWGRIEVRRRNAARRLASDAGATPAASTTKHRDSSCQN
uniref:Uncharacterized protein n=1 Tax=viral metagenome TaxID=1070528 RepID=A0A6M3JF81_9ZZZZ